MKHEQPAGCFACPKRIAQDKSGGEFNTSGVSASALVALWRSGTRSPTSLATLKAALFSDCSANKWGGEELLFGKVTQTSQSPPEIPLLSL